MEVDYKAALLEILKEALLMYMGEYDEPPTYVMIDSSYYAYIHIELGKALVQLHNEGLLPHV